MITQKQIEELGEEFGLGSSLGKGEPFCWFDGNPSSMIYALLQRYAFDAKYPAAILTLESLGYTYHGGEAWKPPLGNAPGSFIKVRDSIHSVLAVSKVFPGDIIAEEYTVSSELEKLYKAAEQGFHVSLCDGEENRYEHVSRFKSLEDLQCFGAAWTAAMLSIKNQGTPVINSINSVSIPGCHHEFELRGVAPDVNDSNAMHTVQKNEEPTAFGLYIRDADSGDWVWAIDFTSIADARHATRSLPNLFRRLSQAQK